MAGHDRGMLPRLFGRDRLAAGNDEAGGGGIG